MQMLLFGMKIHSNHRKIILTDLDNISNSIDFAILIATADDTFN